MRISVFGMGFIGSVTAVCLAELGHQIMATDINQKLLSKLKHGGNPFNEPGFSELLKKHIHHQNITFSEDARELIRASDCSFIVVNTPSTPDGSVNLRNLRACVASVVELIQTEKPDEEHLLVIKSTIPVGTTAELAAEYGGKITFATNPDFTREGKAIQDFLTPEAIVWGTNDASARDYIFDIYPNQNAEYIQTDTNTAELIKYTNNSFHALKIAFANEIGRIATAYDVNANLVMNALCQDTRLNISKAYLKPGFAFGGSCLPKDLKGLTRMGSEQQVGTPLLHAILKSNHRHIEFFAKKIIQEDVQSVGFVGLAFKNDVFDMRESPVIYLMRELRNHGKGVFFYDEDLDKMLRIPSNLSFINRIFPDWENHRKDSEEILHNCCDKVLNRCDLDDFVAQTDIQQGDRSHAALLSDVR